MNLDDTAYETQTFQMSIPLFKPSFFPSECKCVYIHMHALWDGGKRENGFHSVVWCPLYWKNSPQRKYYQDLCLHNLELNLLFLERWVWKIHLSHYGQNVYVDL